MHERVEKLPRIFTIEENIRTRSNLSVQFGAVIHTSLCELLFPTQKNNSEIIYTIFFSNDFLFEIIHFFVKSEKYFDSISKKKL